MKKCSTPNKPNKPNKLIWEERLYHRDQLRAGRYAALADAEGFHAICFALEALGIRLLGKKESLASYESLLLQLAAASVILQDMTYEEPAKFSTFTTLFSIVRNARNDAMHTGVYARHAAGAAIELCIGLEEALMKDSTGVRRKVKEFMVKTPISVEPWHSVAHARQLMLTHSFSFLPVDLNGWKLVTETGLARYLRSTNKSWKELIASSIEDAASTLVLLDAKTVQLEDDVEVLLEEDSAAEVRLWLVLDKNENLCGVLSPFELM